MAQTIHCLATGTDRCSGSHENDLGIITMNIFRQPRVPSKDGFKIPSNLIIISLHLIHGGLNIIAHFHIGLRGYKLIKGAWIAGIELKAGHKWRKKLIHRFRIGHIDRFIGMR